MTREPSNPTRELQREAILNAKGRPRLLLVEDDPDLRTALTRNLAEGFEVTAVGTGTSAVDLLVRVTFDVVLSDIGLPGISGIDLLSLVRSYDLEVPVVLMTGQPTVDTAVAAMEFGALAYVRKPFDFGDITEKLSRAATLARLARAKREAIDAGLGGSPLAGDRAGLSATFDRALAELWIAFQPIVDSQSRRTAAYEALMRTNEPTMPNPGVLLTAAERLGRLDDLGRKVRAQTAAAFSQMDRDVTLFVNLHSTDLLDPELYDSRAPLSKIAPRVVLEITERAALDGVKDLRPRTRALRELGFRIAVDDLGAGYAGLSSFIMLEPELVKLDMSLIRGIDRSPVQHRIVQTLTALCRELSMQCVAEGVETPGELGRVLELGCDYLQGYLFGRPAREIAPAAKTW
ncbi:MAG: EAL domain-containing protein [Labilithrix sp.]|nr:EAL domain-containing protein [Labilithrix sp.]